MRKALTLLARRRSRRSPGATTALGTFALERRLDVGTVRLSIDPGHAGALDLYVPLVDWGVRFPVVRLPARINVDVRSVDRKEVVRLAERGQRSTPSSCARRRATRSPSTCAWRSSSSVAGGLALGVLVALAVRSGRGPRLRTTLLASRSAPRWPAAPRSSFGLPPRSNVDSPQYYANGPEVPTALRALESIGDVVQDARRRDRRAARRHRALRQRARPAARRWPTARRG